MTTNAPRTTPTPPDDPGGEGTLSSSLFREIGQLSGARWAVLALAACAVAVVLLFVDLTPRVESDFFFASDAPELRAAERIDALFPSRPQVLLAARGAVDSEAYAAAVEELTRRLTALDGVATVRSITSGPASPETAFAGPFWRRLLLPAQGPSEEAANAEESAPQLTYLIVESGDDPPEDLIARLEEVLADAEEGVISIAVSGVPFVVERIRRALRRDLRVFTGAALVVFGLVVALLYRDRWVVAGVLATCLTACAATLALLSLAGLSLGVLTANIATIVFVLTLSHLVYLTANARRLGALRSALVVTGEASAWCMATTLAGFLSLLLASAEPLRELGKAGAVGTLVALAAAYGLYPVFLRGRGAPGATPPRSDATGALTARREDPLGGRRLGAAVAVTVALTALAAVGLPRITTDPGLLAYFDESSQIRQGLEVIDAAGGSSPLRIVFTDAGGGRLDTDDALARLGAVQDQVEAEPAVGTALSLAPLVDEAARVPLAGMMGTRSLVDMLSSPNFGGAAESFITADRKRGLLFLRMREAKDRGPSSSDRERVVEQLGRILRSHGFEPEAAAGLYLLQGELADLVAGSLLVGLGGLMALFVGVSWAVARRLRIAVSMMACLLATPVLLFGTLGLAGLPVDFISSPAANVALAVGIDSMIHLVAAVRRLRAEGLEGWAPWVEARARLARPIAGAGLILSAGFGLFLLSSFPPTRRFGLAVVIGVAAATVLTVVVLPWLAARRSEGESTGRT